MRHSSLGLVALLFAAMLVNPLSLNAIQAGGDACAGLSKLKLKDTTITAAVSVAAGEFEIPSGSMERGNSSFFKSAPAFCRVSAEIKPTEDSDIKIEVWMPAEGWNGKYLSHGNGGFAGGIFYLSLAIGLNHGYAMAGTDTGHSGSPVDASWAL